MIENLRYESRLKDMIFNEIERAANSIIETHLVGSMLLDKERPSEQSGEQVKALQTIGIEIRKQISEMDRRSSHQTSLETLSRLHIDTLLSPTQEE